MKSPEETNELVRQLARLFHEAAASTGWGPDIEWSACDGDGHVAMFASAGIGPIPSAALADPYGHVAVWRALEARELSADASGFELFRLAPTRGAFAFDYSSAHGGYAQHEPRLPYRRVGLPEHPIQTEAMPQSAQSYLASIHYRGSCFANVDAIVVEDHFDSIHRPTMWDRPDS